MLSNTYVKQKQQRIISVASYALLCQLMEIQRTACMHVSSHLLLGVLMTIKVTNESPLLSD